MKSEPGNYSIDDLARDKKTDWTGVRNFQARNFMAKDMKPGDWALFYNSNAEPSGVSGLMRIACEAKADRTQFDKRSPYYDERASKEKPVWFCVDVEFEKKLPRVVSIAELRANPKLKNMRVLEKGSRLSILPVREAEFKEILRMAGEDQRFVDSVI